MKYYTTLKILRTNGACKERYKFLKASLPQNTKDNTQISVEKVLEICGVQDALWLVFKKAVPKTQQESLLLTGKWFVCDCAAHVLKHFEKSYPKDKRVRKCIWANKKYLKGEINIDTFRNHRAAADAAAAAAAAAYAAYAAATYAAAAATYAAATYAAAAATYAAADDAAERKWQKKRLLKRLKDGE